VRMAGRKNARKEGSVSAPEPAVKPDELTIDLSGIAGGRLGALASPLLIAAAFGLAVACLKTLVNGGPLYDWAPLLLIAASAGGLWRIVSSKTLKKDLWSYGIPCLLALAALFSYYSASYGYPLSMDYSYFSIMVAMFCLFYALAYQRLMKAETAIVIGLLLASLLTHLVPANADLLSNLDSYWHYKWMQRIVDDGYPPEFDPLTYPLHGGLQMSGDQDYVANLGASTFGLSQANTPMLMQLTYASFALMFKGFGISLYGVAMLLPGILGALTVVMTYLLMKEMFHDMQPYNQIAAFAAAFMLMLSPALGMNSTATNPEDDSFGMFLSVAALFLFFASYHRRSYKYSVLSGLAFLMLRLGWGGGSYAMLTVGIFGATYPLAAYIRNKNAAEHLPYVIIPSFFYQLIGFFAHARGQMPVMHPMSPIEMYPLMMTVGVSLILEMVRASRKGALSSGSVSVEGRTADWIEGNIKVLGIMVIVAGISVLAFYRGPMDFYNFFYQMLVSPAQKSIVHQTVSEQNAMANSFNEFLQEGQQRYGMGMIYGLLMIPVMAWLVYSRGSVGALFLLIWSIPMMWGAYNKSAWIFASSVSVTALGASIGLFAAVDRKELQGLRIIGTILLVFIPVFYVPMFGPWEYGKFVGYVPMHMGPTSDIYYWQPALEWQRDNTGAGDAVLTWWDYGHWLTAVSHRPVLIDNLQADYYEIQDVARFFMNKTDEEDAFKTVEAYDAAYKRYDPAWGLRYVMIDWTMIGKGSALHYIATGDIGNVTPGSWKNYITCEFAPEMSQLDEKLVVGANGSFSKVRRVAFNCMGELAIVFEVQGDGISDISVETRYGQKIPWSTYMKAQDVSLLGVQPFLAPNEAERVPSIMYCAINYKNLPANTICRLPQFSTLVYVPQEFHEFMMTRLYLTKYAQEYRRIGLYNREPKALSHFREVSDRNGDGTPDGEFSFGFVRSYDIDYGSFNDSTF